MGISETFTEPLYTGGRLSSEVPGRFQIALNGRPYVLDLASNLFRRESVPLLRNQADTGGTTGENSINPQELWRRPQDSWHMGAGQRFFDKPDSDPAGFRASKGVDVWTKNLLSLLPDTAPILSATGLLATTADWLYHAGASLQRTNTVTGTPAWTTVTGTPGSAASVASDGFNVYTAHGAAGLYSTASGATTTTSFNTGPATLVRYVKGRLMTANGPSIYNVTTTGAGPTALFTHPNAAFQWVDFAEGPGQIFAAGFAGDKSLIYRTAVLADGTALDTPIVAGELPDGEVVRSVTGYLGFLLIGSDLGVRLANIDASGNLTIGGLIRTPSAVLCFEPQDRFVWYGLSNYDATSTGLGRLDLSVFPAPLTPAYTSDLMADGQSAVTSVVTFAGRRVFTTASNVHAQTDSLVTSGTLDTGGITYGIPDDKVAVYVDVRHEPLLGEVDLALAASPGGLLTDLGGSDAQGSTTPPFATPAGQRASDIFEVRITLRRSVTVPTAGPRVTRTNLRAYPRPTRSAVYQVPILLRESYTTDCGDVTFDVGEELRILTALAQDQTLVTYQEGPNSHTVLVEDYTWQPYRTTPDGMAWTGTLVLKLKQLAG